MFCLCGVVCYVIVCEFCCGTGLEIGKGTEPKLVIILVLVSSLSSRIKEYFDVMHTNQLQQSAKQKIGGKRRTSPFQQNSEL